MQTYFKHLLPRTEECEPQVWLGPPFGEPAASTFNSVLHLSSQFLLRKSCETKIRARPRNVTPGDSSKNGACGAAPLFQSTWVLYLNFLALSFFTCKMGMISISWGIVRSE